MLPQLSLCKAPSYEHLDVRKSSIWGVKKKKRKLQCECEITLVRCGVCQADYLYASRKITLLKASREGYTVTPTATQRTKTGQERQKKNDGRRNQGSTT